MYIVIYNFYVIEDVIYRWRCVLVLVFVNFVNFFLVVLKYLCKFMFINVFFYINLIINIGSGDENISLYEYYS